MSGKVFTFIVYLFYARMVKLEEIGMLNEKVLVYQRNFDKLSEKT